MATPPTPAMIKAIENAVKRKDNKRYLDRSAVKDFKQEVREMPDSQLKDIEKGRVKSAEIQNKRDRKTAKDAIKLAPGVKRADLLSGKTPDEEEKGLLEKGLEVLDLPARYVVRKPIAWATNLPEGAEDTSEGFHKAVADEASRGNTGAQVLKHTKDFLGYHATAGMGADALASLAESAGLEGAKESRKKFGEQAGTFLFDQIDPTWLIGTAKGGKVAAKAFEGITKEAVAAGKTSPTALRQFNHAVKKALNGPKNNVTFEALKDHARLAGIDPQKLVKEFGQKGEYLLADEMTIAGKRLGLGRAVDKVVEKAGGIGPRDEYGVKAFRNLSQRKDFNDMVEVAGRSARANKRTTFAGMTEFAKPAQKAIAALTPKQKKEVVEHLAGSRALPLTADQARAASSVHRTVAAMPKAHRLKGGAAHISAPKLAKEMMQDGKADLTGILAESAYRTGTAVGKGKFRKALMSFESQNGRAGAYSLPKHELDSLLEKEFPSFLDETKKIKGPLGVIARIPETFQKMWKTSKLAYTPAFYAMNMWGDSMMMFTNGLNPVRGLYNAEKLLKKAAKGDAQAKAMLKQLREHGIAQGGHFNRLEVGGGTIEGAKKALERSSGSTGMIDKGLAALGKTEAAKYIPASPVHGAHWEDVSKLAAALEYMRKGDNVSNAAKNAYAITVDFDKPGALDKYGQAIFPFIKYMTRSPQGAVKAIKENPARFAMPAKATSAFSEEQQTDPTRQLKEGGPVVGVGAMGKAGVSAVNKAFGGEDVAGSLYVNPRIAPYEALSLPLGLIDGAINNGVKGLMDPLVQRMGPVPQWAVEQYTGRDVRTGAETKIRGNAMSALDGVVPPATAEMAESAFADVALPARIPRPLLWAANTLLARSGGPAQYADGYLPVAALPEHSQAAGLMSLLTGLRPTEIGPSAQFYEDKNAGDSALLRQVMKQANDEARDKKALEKRRKAAEKRKKDE